ncbi:MAG: helix-turn-helix transcriptional regulator [Treponema sp.]|jgi:transcriptional regulator with XRE-family HTH domain|nr:helix-turn-helix transcriptional regulator [Treponema sp.]
MDLKHVFVRNLRRIRKEAGVSQMKLAAYCDTAASYIGEIEIGRKFPSIEMVEKIATALNVDAFRFFIDGRVNQESSIDIITETDDFLTALPEQVKQDISDRLLTALRTGVEETLNPR